MRHGPALACLLAGLLASLAGCGIEPRHQVQVGIEQLASIAAEGALMADDVARARTKASFVRVHGEELSAQAQHEAEKLSDDPIPPDLKARARTAIDLSSQIGAAIDALRTAPGDRQQAAQDRAALLRSFDEADRLAKSI